MATIRHNERQKRALSPPSGIWWVRPLCLGIIGLGCLLLLLLPRAKESRQNNLSNWPFPSLAASRTANERWIGYCGALPKVPPATDKPGDAVAQQAAAPPSGGARKTSRGPAALHVASGQRSAMSPPPAEARHSVVEALKPSVRRPLVRPLPEERYTAGRRTESAAQPNQSPAFRQELEALVAQFKQAQELTPEGATDLQRLLQHVREHGTEAVPAMRDFLRSQEDVDFDTLSGGELAEQPTLRLTVFDTLRQIGGAEAIEVALEQLRTTQAPAEIALLARTLEEAAPGVYRDEALSAAMIALHVLARSTDSLEVRPLFETLRALGGVEAMTTLEQFPHNADMAQYLRDKDTHISPTVMTYALIALAGLPDGEGVSSLAALAADPNVPVAHKTAGPFQMLVQAAAEHVQAGQALVELAQARQIPDRAWNAVANALAGRHWQFPSRRSDGTLPGKNEANVAGVDTPLVRGFYDDAHHVLYEERAVAGNWSAQQVWQQLALIETLLGATHAPAASQALQQARETLQGKAMRR